MKNIGLNRMIVTMVAVSFLALPIFAQPNISVTSVGGGLNGTNHSLQVDLTSVIPDQQAMVISNHPTNEKTFNVSFVFNPNAIETCPGVTCRVFVYQAFGRELASDPFDDVLRVGIKEVDTASGVAHRIFLWYKDDNSTNMGQWEQLNGFFAPNATADVKIGIEWRASDPGMNNAEVRFFRNDVLNEEITGFAAPYEVDIQRFGYINGASRSGANGTFFLDEFVSTR